MNKKNLLYALVVILAVSVAYRMLHPYRQGKVARLTYVGSRKRVVVKRTTLDKDALKKAPGIMLKLVSKPPRHRGDVIRNPFFKEGSRGRLPVPVPTKHTKNTAKPLKEDPRSRLQKELSLFRVFGSYKGDGKNMIFLLRGKDILIVQAGDKIDGKYMVKRIEENSLDLWSEEIQQDIHIDLSEF